MKPACHILITAFITLLAIPAAVVVARADQITLDRHLLTPEPVQPAEKGAGLLAKMLDGPLGFFDGGKIQVSNSYPKLTHVNHQIDLVNKLTNTNLRDWDSMLILTLDFVVWKDLSRYFKVDFAVALGSGALLTSDHAFRNTLRLNTRFRQRYDVMLLWSNLYYYPFGGRQREVATGRLIDPFLAVGLGYTFLREETAIKFRRKGFYDRVKTNFSDTATGYKVMGGFDVNLVRLSPRLARLGLTVSLYHIWNRMKGHANTHLTEDLRIGRRSIDADLHYKEPMDIDLTGFCWSLALSYRF